MDGRTQKEMTDLLSVKCFDCTEVLRFPVQIRIDKLEEYKTKKVQIDAFNKAHIDCQNVKVRDVWDVATYNAQEKVQYALDRASEHLLKEIKRGDEAIKESKAIRDHILEVNKEKYKPLSFFTEQCNT